MNQNEFCKLTGKLPTEEEWAVIHDVYQHHPAVPDVGGKEKLASLYKLGGMGLLREMRPAAVDASELEARVQDHKKQIAFHEQQVAEIQKVLGNRKKAYLF